VLLVSVPPRGRAAPGAGAPPSVPRTRCTRHSMIPPHGCRPVLATGAVRGK